MSSTAYLLDSPGLLEEREEDGERGGQAISSLSFLSSNLSPSKNSSGP